MPTTSEHRQLIQLVLLDAKSDMDQCLRNDPNVLVSLSESPSDSDSDTGLSTSTSSDTSSSSSSFSSSPLSVIAAQDDDDTDEELTMALDSTADLLQMVTETHILNLHIVAKCSQLHLVLVKFKMDNPK